MSLTEEYIDTPSTDADFAEFIEKVTKPLAKPVDSRPPINTKVDLASIPVFLKAQKRWGLWRPIWKVNKQGRGKWDKRPVLSTNQPDEWLSFEDAVNQLKANPGYGLGFCVTGSADMVAFDLDHCIKGDGELEDWAFDIIERLDSYTEVSVGGSGIRVFVKGSFGEDWTTRNGKIALEVYSGHGGRYLTVTGNVWETLKPVREVSQEALDDLASVYRVTSGTTTSPKTEMPELLEGVEVPTGLSAKVMKFLETGETDNPDLSHMVTSVANALAAAGLSRQAILSVLYENEFTFGVALNHRGADADRALVYLWQHHVCKTKAKPVTAEDFAERRAAQREENERIGRLGMGTVPRTSVITLDTALSRFVLLSEHGFVFDRLNPDLTIKLPNWKTTYAASKVFVKADEKPIPVSALWVEHAQRLTTHTETFRPGHGEFTVNPKFVPAANTWKPFDRSGPTANIQIFLDQVEFLFGDESERFLDWLAHIEQEPGVLPHTCWLHISPRTGTGRNWLASALVRVWAGQVAPNLELTSVLEGDFNDELSGRILAVVDEIREGASDSRWASSEKFKKSVNPETRNINKKYGLKVQEWNLCRWLMFSNHLQAIPIDDDDRRIEVVINDKDPLSEAHYMAMYSALGDPAFINGIARFLLERDISNFNPGRRAKESTAREQVILATKSETDLRAEELVEEWSSDIIQNSALREFFGGLGLPPGAKSALARKGAVPLGKTLRVGNASERVWILRNAKHWLAQPASAQAEEVRRGLASRFK